MGISYGEGFVLEYWNSSMGELGNWQEQDVWGRYIQLGLNSEDRERHHARARHACTCKGIWSGVSDAGATPRCPTGSLPAPGQLQHPRLAPPVPFSNLHGGQCPGILASL